MGKRSRPRREKWIGKPCSYCGVPMEAPTLTGDKRRQVSKDHALRPKSWKGAKPARNAVMCCLSCNREKGDRSLPVWIADLRAANDPRHERASAALRALLERSESRHCQQPAVEMLS